MDIFTSYMQCIDAIKKEAEKDERIDKTVLDKKCEIAKSELNTLKMYLNDLVKDLNKTDTLSMRGIHTSCIKVIDNLQDDLGFVGDKRVAKLKSPYDKEEEEDFDR